MSIQSVVGVSLPDFREGDALQGVHQEHAGDQVSRPGAQMGGQLVDAWPSSCDLRGKHISSVCPALGCSTRVMSA